MKTVIGLAMLRLERGRDFPHILPMEPAPRNSGRNLTLLHRRTARMSRVSLFSAPFLLGFEALEERVDRMAKAADGYPPYNIERQVESDGSETFFISIAVAGFAQSELELTAEDNTLFVR